MSEISKNFFVYWALRDECPKLFLAFRTFEWGLTATYYCSLANVRIYEPKKRKRFFPFAIIKSSRIASVFGYSFLAATDLHPIFRNPARKNTPLTCA